MEDQHSSFFALQNYSTHPRLDRLLGPLDDKSQCMIGPLVMELGMCSIVVQATAVEAMKAHTDALFVVLQQEHMNKTVSNIYSYIETTYFSVKALGTFFSVRSRRLRRE